MFTLYFFSSVSGSAQPSMARVGQQRMHSPQSMHRSDRITAFPFRTRMAWTRQSFTQIRQPVQRRVLTLTELR